MRTLLLGLSMLLSLALGPATAAELQPVAGRHLIDVRTTLEWNIGHVEGAVHVPLKELPGRIGELLPDPSTPIALYCHSGGRSAKARELLMEMGYTDVVDYGGLEEAAARVTAAKECPAGASC